jgi:glycerol-3-phosphate dehydrogenase (NAD(P)+)
MSSKAAYVSEAAKEIRDLAVKLGARNETFEMGTHAWLGDVLTTSFGKSRNRKFGELCGKGHSAEQAAAELEKDRKHAEGYLTTKSFFELSKKHGMNLPILAAINAVLHENQKVLDVLPRMFQRSKL